MEVSRAPRWVIEGGALGAVVVAIGALQVDLLAGGTTVGMDSATAFYPWYAFLGQRLRAGQIPVWNPAQFSGTPFAADPESGWMYLPAMVFFTALPLPSAAAAYLVFHVLLAGLTAYALARTLRLGLAGSLVASIAYACSGFLYGHNVCCFAYAGVAAWLPLIILGAERAVQATTLRRRGLWCGVAGLGLSQVFGVWLGQGAYYAVLMLAAYLAFRRLTPVPRSARAARARCAALALDTLGSLAFGFGLAAAGILPRLEFNLLSNLPLGYPDVGSSQVTSAGADWALITGWGELLVRPGFYSMGLSVALAAVAAVVLAPHRRELLIFGLLPLASLVLSQEQPTPLQGALSVLPGFERLTARTPQRAMLVLYLGPAVLAGAAAAAARRPHALLSATLVLVVYADLRSAAQVELADALQGAAAYELRRVNLTEYYQPTEAARFLQSMAEREPSRYLGYAGHVFGGPLPYTLRWADPGTRALEVNNRALMTGLQDVQGYDPIHLDRYDRFVAAMNGREQNYHHADVFETGLDSPLLDLLNARYLLLPTEPAPDEALPRLSHTWPVVFQDHAVTVLENPSALPRAWVVHAARQVSQAEALDLLAAGAVDPRREALLEEAPPDLAPAVDAVADASSVIAYQPEHLELQVRTDAPGLVVLSEVYYPAWQASVDGETVPLYVADAALRAVPVPAGEHTIELRYQSATLTAGLVITLASAAALVGLAAANARERRAACA